MIIFSFSHGLAYILLDTLVLGFMFHFSYCRRKFWSNDSGCVQDIFVNTFHKNTRLDRSLVVFPSSPLS